MAERTARIVGGERGVGLVIARGLAAGFRLVDDGAEEADLVVLVLNGAVASFDAAVAARLRPFHDMVARCAAPLRARDGAFLVVVAVAPGGGPWPALAADWIAAGIARCAADWSADRGPAAGAMGGAMEGATGRATGPRINGIVAALDDGPALPRFLAPRAAGAARPADVAAAALALCADSAGAITGQVLRIGSARP